MSYNSSFKYIKRSLPLFAVLVVMFAFTGVLSPTFLKVENMMNIMLRLSPLLVASCGQTFVILLSGIDMSLGAVVSLTTSVIALGSIGPVSSPILLVFLSFALGIGFGLLNGYFVYKGIAPIIMTIGTSVIAKGIALIIRPIPGGMVSLELAEFLGLEFGGIFSVPMIISFSFFIFLMWILHWTRFGRHLYATGANRDAAKRAGVEVKKTIIVAYVISSISAVVCGLLVVGQIWSGDALIGEVYTMDSVTSVLVGGTTFSGGEGGLLGTLAGAFIISMLSNILNMLNVFSYFQYIIKGLILIISIFISFRFFSRRRKVYE